MADNLATYFSWRATLIQKRALRFARQLYPQDYYVWGRKEEAQSMKNLGNVGFPGILLNQHMPWKRVGGTEFQCFIFKKYQQSGFFLSAKIH